MSFYIEKIIVTGAGKRDSIIELSKGLNIIYGPSNTGKTYIVKCIDFMFGSDKEPDMSTGYQTIKMIVNTQHGSIHMSRKIGENKIEIISNDNHIASGIYSTKASKNNYEKTINFVWLSLIGINDMHLIIKNENFKKQILSWRTFCHMFMLTETKIISEHSTILSVRDASNTAVIACLIFLLTGQDFAEAEPIDSKEIKEAKKNAVKSYINKELFRLSERNQELLTQIKEHPGIDITHEIETIISKISEYEEKLNIALEENQNILSQLHEKNEALSECNVLLSRYEELNSQYASDLKRLSFIIDGEVNLREEVVSHCPFCDNQVNINNTHNYIDAAKAEHKRIQLQARDLEKAFKALCAEKKSLELEIAALISKKISTEEIIENDIKPQLSVLKDKLSSYRNFVERQKEMAILKQFSEQKVADMIDNEANDENEIRFKVKEHLDYNFINELTNGVKLFLEKCNYENLLSLSFDKATMDIVINGKKKGSNGKGYNAFFNSIVAIVLSRYMNNNANFASNLLVLDSPILSLKEKEAKKPSDTMKYALFENLVGYQSEIQTIVIENEIPDIDYKNTRLIHFTKEKGNGRYGFLMDVTD